jgi:conjugal transfer pilus assembly protein TraI
MDYHLRRVDLIAQCANEASRGEFERKWLSILTRCADWFTSMPLNPDIYREPGGAFRCTVETAFYAMRLAGGQKFGTNLPSEKRRRIEPQYNYAVFLAAVCSRLDEPYRHFEIVRDTDRTAWNPSVNGAAGPWMTGGPYRVVRRTAPLPVERMRTGMLAQMLIGPELLTGLDAEVLSELFGAINPNMKPLEAESLLHKVIRQAVETAVEFDRKAQRAVFEPVQFAVPSAIHVAAELQPAPVAAPIQTPASGSGSGSGSGAVGTGVPTSAPDSPEASSPPGPPSQMAPTDADDQTAAINRPSTDAGAAGTSSGAQQPEPQSLLEAIGCASGEGGTPRGVTAGVAREEMTLVNPVDMRAPAAPVGNAASAETHPLFEEVLKGTPNMIRELFKALREDVAAGTAKVAWNDKGLVVPKRLIGSYGVASDTLVEHLRKRSLLVGNEGTEITLGPRAGQLILGQPS